MAETFVARSYQRSRGARPSRWRRGSRPSCRRGAGRSRSRGSRVSDRLHSSGRGSGPWVLPRSDRRPFCSSGRSRRDLARSWPGWRPHLVGCSRQVHSPRRSWRIPPLVDTPLLLARRKIDDHPTCRLIIQVPLGPIRRWSVSRGSPSGPAWPSSRCPSSGSRCSRAAGARRAWPGVNFRHELRVADLATQSC